MSFHNEPQFPGADTLSLRFAGVGDAGAFDQGGSPELLNLAPAGPSASAVLPAMPGAGLGLSVGRESSDLEYLQSLPTSQKIGLMLQSFSAGVAGRPNPIDAVLVEKRRKDQEHRQELVATGNLLMKALEERRKYGANTIQGKAITNVFKPLLGPTFGPLLDQIGEAEDGPGFSKALAIYHPKVQQKLFDLCRNDPNAQACYAKQLNDKTGMDDLYRLIDADLLPAMLPKFDQIGKMKEAGLLKEFQEEDGTIKMSRVRLLEINAKLKSLGGQPFDQFELDSLSRPQNQEALVAKGFVPDSALKAGAEKAEKVAAGAETWRATNLKVGGKIVSGRVDKQGNIEVQDADGEWTAAPKGATLAGAESLKAPAGPKAAKGLTVAQVKANKEIDDALAHMKRRGIEPGTPGGEKKLAELTAQEIPNEKGSMLLNRKRVDDTTASRIKADYAKALKQKYGEGGETPPTAAAPKPAAPAPQPQAGPAPKWDSMTARDKQAALDAAIAAANSAAGDKAHLEKVKRRFREKYGADLEQFLKKP